MILELAKNMIDFAEVEFIPYKELILVRNIMKKHSKRYRELIKLAKTRGPIDEFGYFFTDEEIEFLCKEDLVGFAEKFPAEAEDYMSE